MKKIIITGGTRGLGLSHANFLAGKGYHLALVDISRDAGAVYQESDSMENLLDELRSKGVRVEFYGCDLTNPEVTYQIFHNIISDFNGVDGVVSNVGGDVIGRDSRASGGKALKNTIEISQENHDEIFDRNYLTCFNTLRAIIPHFKEKKTGKIVTTTSISAGYGVEKETAYAISKSAVLHLTRCVATELRDYDVNVNCIAPGATLTGRFMATMESRSQVDKEKIFATDASFLKKPADPKYVSSVVEFLLSPASDYISGQVIRIDGGQFTTPM